MTTLSPAPAPTRPCGASGCADFEVSRRSLLGGAALALGTTTAIGSAVLSASPASATSAPAVLVVVSMRGACDGMSLAVPYGDPTYYKARPRIGVPQSALLVPDGFFGLHPKLAPLLPLWQSGEMATIQATGMPVPNRSHQAAIEVVEDADPGSSARVGWLNRLLGTRSGSSPLQGFAVGGLLPTSLTGPQPAISGRYTTSMAIAGDDGSKHHNWRRQSLHTTWDHRRTVTGKAMKSVFDMVDAVKPAATATDDTSHYPATDFGRALATASRLIRGDVGVQVITVDDGIWDMHSGLGTLTSGDLLYQADQFAGGIAAFFNDLGDQRSKVTMVCLSEFGRRVVENANYGLDHGYGNAMWAFGAGVKGGAHYGTFPALSLGTDADLLVTTDYRNVLADVVQARFGASYATVFPGLARQPVGFMAGV